ncbi:MAG: MlaD family protein [Gammaproteobacteria bacterium]|nr:MlaD family protein [Gammaproteobacteria bacterium]MDH5387438.1 MlaD family protein [Gammaproteobacteria bacterium]
MPERRSLPRTHYIHRISYSTQERIVGIFVLLALFILLGLLLSSGKTKNLFEDYVTIYGELQSVQAVNKDAEVVISGLPAGTVTSVDITDDNKVILTMKILKKYHNLLREDSEAKLSSFNFAVVQKSMIEITTGSNDKALLKDGSTIAINEAFNIKEMIAKIEPIFVSLEDSIKKMNNVLSAIDHDKLEVTLDNMNVLTTDIRNITQHMAEAKGLMGSMIYEKEMETNVKSIAVNMVDVTNNLRTTTLLINKQIEDMPELVNKIGPLLKEADKTIKASQRIWPLSTAIGENNESSDTLTSPSPAND